MSVIPCQHAIPNEWQEDCAQLRRDIFQAAQARGIAHVASSLSCVEILYALYFGDSFDFDPSKQDKIDRDRLILSKGHGSLALYATLAARGYFDRNELLTFSQPDSRLGGEPNRLECPGVEATTGSLGHGLSIALGLSVGSKIDAMSNSIIAVLGDGECQEGSIWEAAALASGLGVNNLIAIIDTNRVQKEAFTADVVGTDDLQNKWAAFGWKVLTADGHDCAALAQAYAEAAATDGPCAIIAHTTKGKGLSFMENKPEWHYRMPRKKELAKALSELGIEEG